MGSVKSENRPLFLFSLALRRDGTVVSWGAYNFGQSTVPEGLSNVIAIAGGGSSSAAVVFIPGPAASFVSALASDWIRVLAMAVLAIMTAAFFWTFGRRRGSASGDFNAQE